MARHQASWFLLGAIMLSALLGSPATGVAATSSKATPLMAAGVRALLGPPTTTSDAQRVYYGKAVVHLNVVDNGLGIQTTFYAVDNSLDHQYGTVATITGLGAHTLTFASCDLLGNWEGSHIVQFVIYADTIPPATSFSLGAPYYVGSGTMVLRASDSGMGVAATYHRVDGGPTSTDPTIFLGLPGAHTIEYWSVDGAGNIEPHKTAISTVVVPRPTGPTTFCNAWSTQAGKTTIALSVYWPSSAGYPPPASTTYVRLDGGATQVARNVTAGAIGNHSIEFWTVTGADEEPHKTVTFEITGLDMKPPRTWVVQTPTEVPAVIRLSATDEMGTTWGENWVSGVAHTYCRLDGAAEVEGAEITVGAAGTRTLEFWSVDAAGNAEAHTTQVFRLGAPTPTDTAAPTTAADAVASYAGTAAIHLSAVDEPGGSGIAHTYYRLDGATQASGTVVVAAGAGAHTLEFWSVDVAGNAETPHKTAEFAIVSPAVDVTPPLTISDARGSYAESATVRLTATDNPGGSGVAHSYYRLDGAPPAAGDVVVVAGAGAHTLEFWSVDVAGNVETPHKTAEFAIVSPAVDVTPPLTISDARGSYAESATVRLTATDNPGGSGVAHSYYRLDGAPPAAGDVVVVAGAGAHTLEFWSVDVAGNVETPHKTAEFAIVSPAVDVTPPLTISDARGSYAESATVRLTATDNLGGPGVAHTYYRLDGAPQMEGATVAMSIPGTHILEFWSVDVAGNIEHPHKMATLAIAKAACSLALKRNRGSLKRGQKVVLSGTCKPVGMAGQTVVVEVRPPRSTAWRRLAARVATAKSGVATWSYAYTFKRSATKGSYLFRTVYNGPTYQRRTSASAKVTVR